MAVTGFIYTGAVEAAFAGAINDIGNAGNSTKVALLEETYTPNQNTHTSWADVSSHQASGTGYTAGGQSLTNKSWSSSAGVITFDCDNPEWDNSTITAHYAVFYDDEPSSAGDKTLLALVDFGENRSSENGTMAINIHASGLFSFDVNVT